MCMYLQPGSIDAFFFLPLLVCLPPSSFSASCRVERWYLTLSHSLSLFNTITTFSSFPRQQSRDSHYCVCFPPFSHVCCCCSFSGGAFNVSNMSCDHLPPPPKPTPPPPPKPPLPPPCQLPPLHAILFVSVVDFDLKVIVPYPSLLQKCIMPQCTKSHYMTLNAQCRVQGA